MNSSFSLFLLICLILFYCCFSTLSKSDKKKKSSQSSKKVNLFDLYDEVQLDYKRDILNASQTYSEKLVSVKSFNMGSTLAYVTPWNNYGYDIAKRLANKFSFISPVWLGISYDGSEFHISGIQDIDLRWTSELKMTNKNVKVIPRVLFEHWNKINYEYVITNEYLSNQLTEKLGKIISKYNFDGLVLEIWLQIGAYYKTETIHFIKHLSYIFKEKKLLLLLAIPPPVYSGNNAGIFNGDDFNELQSSIDYFSLMTYDYSSQSNSGPNAPIDWMKKCVELLDPSGEQFKREKILMGLNFYGYKYSYSESGPIIRHELTDILKVSANVEVVWHRDVKEHEFRVQKVDGSFLSIWYPTKQSVDLRVKLAESLGVGISIWEIGQGLDYFYDVL